MATQKVPQKNPTQSCRSSDAKRAEGGGHSDLPILKKIVICAIFFGIIFSLWMTPSVDYKKEWATNEDVHYSSDKNTGAAKIDSSGAAASGIK